MAQRTDVHRILFTKEHAMILPVALVDRWPADEYKRQHDSIESALKHNVTDLLRLRNEVKILKQIEQQWALSPIPEEYLTKEIRNFIKRDGGDQLGQEFIQYIINQDAEFDRCLKFSDYPAMVMAAYPESRFVAKNRFWDLAEDIIKDPVLIRGISSGKIGKFVQEHGQDYYFIETGYLGNYRCDNNRTGRKVYHRIVKNAMQHSTIMDVPDDRWKALVNFNPALEYKGWRRTGSKILVVLPTEKPFQYYGHDREKWIQKVEKTIKKHSDREIVWRQNASRGERTNDTIYDALDNDIYALVTYNSIATVEAVQHGIPAFGLAPTAADPVCSNSLAQIENPVMPSEDIVYKWLCSIAYSQFSLDELITGQAWEMVLENAHRPTLDY
jgi:hypothetical protein